LFFEHLILVNFSKKAFAVAFGKNPMAITVQAARTQPSRINTKSSIKPAFTNLCLNPLEPRPRKLRLQRIQKHPRPGQHQAPSRKHHPSIHQRYLQAPAQTAVKD
jgi:hypothetical protein